MKQFAEMTDALLGEQVSVLTLRDWCEDDAWNSQIVVSSFDASEELRRTRVLLDLSKDYILREPEDTLSRDLASLSSSYRRLLGKLHITLIQTMSEEITEVRDRLFQHIMHHRKARSPSSHIGTMSAVWIALEKHITFSVEEEDEEETFSADQIILRQRTNGD